MQVYVTGSPERFLGAVAELLTMGVDILEMGDKPYQKLADVLLECDVVLAYDFDYEPLQLGVEIGLALGYGKPVYFVQGPTDVKSWAKYNGIQWFPNHDAAMQAILEIEAQERLEAADQHEEEPVEESYELDQLGTLGTLGTGKP